MPKGSLDFLMLWYEAAAEDRGLRLSVDDPEAVRDALYEARRKSGDPTLDKLSIRIMGEQVWLVRQERGDGSEE